MRAAPILRRRAAPRISDSRRRFLAGAAALALLAGPAAAEDISVSSRITAATLFPDAANVTREALFEAPAGRHVIILEDAPAALDPATLRIEGDSASGSYVILNTERGAIALEPTEEQNAERAAIEDEIEETLWRLRAAEDAVGLARERIDYVRRFRAATATAPTEGGGALLGSQEGWDAAWETLDEEAAEAAAALRDAERRVVGVRDELAVLRRELALVGPEAQSQTVLKITIDAEAPVEGGRLEIAYLTGQASWRPLYDIRLDEAEDDVAAGTVEITRRAAIRQSTGEDWIDVEVTLSTARPSGRLGGFIPPEVVAQISEPIVIIDGRLDASDGYARAPAVSVDEPYLLEDSVSGGLGVLSEAAPLDRERAETAGAAARLEGDRVVYVLDERQTITGDGSTSFALIGEDTLDARLEARTAPVIERTAYLTAIATLEAALPPGVASVYRGEAYLGQARLAYVGPGAEAELPFGAVEGLRIEYEVVERVRGADDRAFDDTTTTRERFLIRAINLTDEALPVVVYAASPVSEDEKIAIEPTTTPEPDEDRVEGRRGVLAWRFELAAGATEEINFGWDIAWPEDDEIVFSAR